MENRVGYSLPPSLCQSRPWLIISHGQDAQRQTFFDISKNYYISKIIPELCDKGICHSCSSYGWLVLKDYTSHDCSLLNLVSMEMIELPPIEYSTSEYCILWLPPSDPNSHLLVVYKDFLMLWRPGDTEFVRKEFLFDVEFNSFSTINVHEGNIYALVAPHRDIVKADFKDPIVHFKKLINGEKPTLGLQEGHVFYNSYLVECNDEMLLVYKIYSASFLSHGVVSTFEIFRLDYSKDAWIKVKDIGERTIFLSEYQGRSSFVSNPQVKTNSIYFTQHRHLCIFDLDDQSIELSLPCPNVSKSNSAFCWIWG